MASASGGRRSIQLSYGRRTPAYPGKTAWLLDGRAAFNGGTWVEREAALEFA